jgi:hypothetical protein
MTEFDVTYRRDPKTETWRVFGPAALVQPGPVIVTLKSGEQRLENVVRVTRPFDADGIECCYGYLERDESEPGVCSACGGTGRTTP